MQHLEAPIRLGFIAEHDESDIKWAQGNGLPNVEYNYHVDFDDSFPQATQMHLWLRQHLVHACALGCWGQDFISKDAAKRDEALRRLKHTIDYAAHLHCPIVMTGGGDREGDQLDAKLKDVVAIYKGIPEYAEERNVRVCFYNCPWANCVTGPAAWDVVLKQLPGIGIKFDPSHPYNAGDDPYAHLADYGEHVIHFHAKEVLKVGDRVVDEPMAGQGDFDWGKLIGILYKKRYKGVISIEPHSETWSGAMRRPGILIAKRELERFLVDSF
ncbi:MAG: sugar phosphate isomerase/epimerase family protein [Fimbriimonadales bacterium]